MEEGPLWNEEDGDAMEQPLLSSSNRKGGFRTVPFILANAALEKVVNQGLLANMILYLTRVYGMESVYASNVIFLWSAATNFTPIVCAFLADSYLGRFPMISAGCIFSVLGLFALWLTAAIPRARPFCDQTSGRCDAPSVAQLLLLYSSYALMSIGSGCLQSANIAFGVDQLHKESKSNPGILNTYFNLCVISASVGGLIGMSVIVYIQDHMGWPMGFAVPAVLMLLYTVAFLSASPLFVKLRPSSSWCVGFVQVAVAAYKKRHMRVPSTGTSEMYHHKNGSSRSMPSVKLRFLNKACMIRNSEEVLTSDGRDSDPWSLCTVEQVENLKTLVGIIPLWSTGILVYAALNQSCYVLQVASMDRHLTPTFEVPAGSFGAMIIVSLIISIILYDHLILPLASKCRGKPTRLSGKIRMGVGIVPCIFGLAVSAMVESNRRAVAIKEGFSDDPNAVVSMSAFWTLPRYIFFGMVDAFNGIGNIQFYYFEFPKVMSSVAMSLFGLSVSVANVAGSFLMTVVDDITKASGGMSWVSSNINKAHTDYYYWLLCGLLFANSLYFLACSKSYGPSKEEVVSGSNDEEDHIGNVN